jgi:CII-binding regulator of phage lambda lysogenization HflD
MNNNHLPRIWQKIPQSQQTVSCDLPVEQSIINDNSNDGAAYIRANFDAHQALELVKYINAEIERGGYLNKPEAQETLLQLKEILQQQTEYLEQLPNPSLQLAQQIQDKKANEETMIETLHNFVG